MLHSVESTVCLSALQTHLLSRRRTEPCQLLINEPFVAADGQQPDPAWGSHRGGQLPHEGQIPAIPLHSQRQHRTHLELNQVISHFLASSGAVQDTPLSKCGTKGDDKEDSSSSICPSSPLLRQLASN